MNSIPSWVPLVKPPYLVRDNPDCSASLLSAFLVEFSQRNKAFSLLCVAVLSCTLLNTLSQHRCQGCTCLPALPVGVLHLLLSIAGVEKTGRGKGHLTQFLHWHTQPVLQECHNAFTRLLLLCENTNNQSPKGQWLFKTGGCLVKVPLSFTAIENISVLGFTDR